MRNLNSGITIIELLLYLNLFGFLANLLFGFAWQINYRAKNMLIKHNQLNTLQTALERLARDLRECDSTFQLNPDRYIKLVCQTKTENIQWICDKAHVLKRQGHKFGHRKARTAKVAEDIGELKIYKIGAKRGVAIVISISNQEGKLIEKRIILARQTLKI